VSRNPHKRRCEGLKLNGERCKKWADPRSEEALCYQHLIGEEAWKELQREGGRTRGAQRREEAKTKPGAGLAPSISLADVLRICVPALTAVYEATGEPDWSARLTAAGTILAAFPSYLRSTPKEVRNLLATVLPPEVYSHPEAQHRVTPGAVYRAMRAEYDRLPDTSPLVGIQRHPYPPHTIGEWEDPKTVYAGKPADAHPPEDEPIEIEDEPDDGGLVRAGHILH
jgi:hypothetical protein